jgi:hypothetical protein
MTDAERKAAERQRKKAAGLVRVDEWVPAERVEEIRRIAEKMREERMDDKRNTKPPEGHPDELTWLRGYEAGVIDMRAERDGLAECVEELRAIAERMRKERDDGEANVRDMS